jgi:hypothetical protein
VSLPVWSRCLLPPVLRTCWVGWIAAATNVNKVKRNRSHPTSATRSPSSSRAHLAEGIGERPGGQAAKRAGVDSKRQAEPGGVRRDLGPFGDCRLGGIAARGLPLPHIDCRPAALRGRASDEHYFVTLEDELASARRHVDEKFQTINR